MLNSRKHPQQRQTPSSAFPTLTDPASVYAGAVQDEVANALDERNGDQVRRFRELERALDNLENLRVALEEERGEAVRALHREVGSWRGGGTFWEDTLGISWSRAWQLGTGAGSHPYKTAQAAEPSVTERRQKRIYDAAVAEWDAEQEELAAQRAARPTKKAAKKVAPKKAAAKRTSTK